MFRLGRLFLFGLIVALLSAPGAVAQSNLPDGAPQALTQFDTDWSNHSVDLSELRSGGPPKDGIPSIDAPSFLSADAASEWIEPHEPVILLEHHGVAKAYPLQILIYHEIVNDVVGGTPVAITFCPLCYSAVVFVRVVDGAPVTFGVSGMLRHSDMVMYDRRTESLWQQVTGRAIVGDQTGATLKRLPAQILSFEHVRQHVPDVRILDRPEGVNRPYGRNPYAGYDDVSQRPFLYDGPSDGRLPPMEKAVTVSRGNEHVAYPHSTTRAERVIHDDVDGTPLVVFHAPGAVSALDADRIADSRGVGSTGVFDRRVGEQTLTFAYDADAGDAGRFTDDQTGSTWTILGRAVDGPLQGTQLTRIPHGDYFAFAWFAFRPETRVYGVESEPPAEKRK